MDAFSVIVYSLSYIFYPIGVGIGKNFSSIKLAFVIPLFVPLVIGLFILVLSPMRYDIKKHCVTVVAKDWIYIPKIGFIWRFTFQYEDRSTGKCDVHRIIYKRHKVG